MIEQKKNNIEQKSVNISEIYKVIDRYNQFLFNQEMNRRFNGNEEKGPEFENDEKSGYLKENEIDNLLSKNTENLDSIGLIYEKRQEDEYSSPKIVLTLQKGERFIKYLDTLKQKEISNEEREVLDRFLLETVNNLSSGYSLESDTDVNAILELRTYIKDITEKIQNLVKDENEEETALFKSAYNFVEPLKSGWFKEYGQLLNENVFNKYWGPDKWHQDATPKLYREKWQKIVDILIKLLEEKPNLVKETDKVLNHLVVSLKTGMEDIEKSINDPKQAKNKGHMEDLHLIMKEIYKELSHLVQNE
jgi:hypothetical protein